MVKVSNDARRAVDYMQSRPDIRADDIAYVATSWGAAVGTRTLRSSRASRPRSSWMAASRKRARSCPNWMRSIT